LLCVLGSAQAQTRRALIIGIDTYQPAGTTAQHDAGCTYGRCELGSFENLEGAVNDAQSIADMLTGPKFGFPTDKVVLLTNPAARRSRPGEVVLPADQTTHDGVLAAMKKYLVEVPERGDTVVFYYAGHGSLRVNTAGEKLTVRGEDGKLVYVDSTLVPSDVYKGGYDVRDREMTRIFNAALDKGIHLTVIFDSCHSGGSTRGLSAGRQRSLPYDPRPVNDPPDSLPSGQRVVPPTERVDNPALVFAAVQQDQAANEADASDTMPDAGVSAGKGRARRQWISRAGAGPGCECHTAIAAAVWRRGGRSQRGQGAGGGAEGRYRWNRLAGYRNGLRHRSGKRIYGDYGKQWRACGEVAGR
jgi:hypothetical protein